jgi:CDP-paratose 2-epimerase
MLAHHFGRPLRYIGFEGSGKQVRDLLHVEDLLLLIDEQLTAPERWDGVTANVGGGNDCCLSLRETSTLCAEITGNAIEVDGSAETRPGDVPIYVSDCRKLFELTSWRPEHGAREVLEDIHGWIQAHEAEVRAAL